ncbi:unnamed protein product, partial [Cyprideis torosa]
AQLAQYYSIGMTKGKEKMDKKIPSCFKAYDIRGQVPGELNADLAKRIGLGLAEVTGLGRVIVGRDMRLSGEELSSALIEGLLAAGCDVVDIGMCGTEEMYHAVFSLQGEGVDGGVIVTASHNPADYNGMKIVEKGARPLSGEAGLPELARYVVSSRETVKEHKRGRYERKNHRREYIKHLLAAINLQTLKPFTIVANCGNGCAGPVLEMLRPSLPFTFELINSEPDGTFPNGVPNPLLPERRAETSEAVRAYGADLGIAWDGDFDRCF